MLCVTLCACSTMERSSTGQGSFDPEPVAEPASTVNAQALRAPDADTSIAPIEPSASAVATVESSRAPTQVQAATGTTAPSPQSAASKDVDQAKRELAEYEAKINSLRNEQEKANRQMEEEAARRSVQEEVAPEASANGAATVSTESAGGRRASPVATTKAEDPIAVFPSDRSIEQDSAVAQAVEQPLQHSVYFDYDKSEIKGEYDPVVLANAAYLKSHPNGTTEIEGNCDERGSREYNLALGARRAEALKRALELAGADGKKLKTVSFGSEKPIALGKDEESYSKNRRADIVDITYVR